MNKQKEGKINKHLLEPHDHGYVPGHVPVLEKQADFEAVVPDVEEDEQNYLEQVKQKDHLDHLEPLGFQEVKV